MNVFANSWPRNKGVALVYDGDGNRVSETAGGLENLAAPAAIHL